MRDIKKIIIHCSDTPWMKEFHASDLDRWHKERGFDCIGYHYVICLDGTIEVGRPLDKVGAHCYGQNQHSIGICYIGGRDNKGYACDTRTLSQTRSLITLINSLCLQFPYATVHGHNEFAKKACPCFDVQKVMRLYSID